MNLYAWQPMSAGQYAFYICARNETEAMSLVEAEIGRRLALDPDDPKHIYDREVEKWRTDDYELTVVPPGTVLENFIT